MQTQRLDIYDVTVYRGKFFSCVQSCKIACQRLLLDKGNFGVQVDLAKWLVLVWKVRDLGSILGEVK